MELHSLPQTNEKKKKRLGQGHGSGRVKTSGRGTKGQKARGNVPLRFEGGALALIKRLPFLRGKGRNRSLQQTPVVIDLSILDTLPAKTVIDLDALIKHNIVSEKAKLTGVKVLGNGDIKNIYTVKVPTSKSAAEKITNAGGTVESA